MSTDPATWELVACNRATWDTFLADGLTKKPGDRKLREALAVQKALVEEALEIQDAYASKRAKEMAAAASKAHYDNLPRKKSTRLLLKEEARRKKIAEEEEESRRLEVLNPLAMQAYSPTTGHVKALRFDHNLTREERAELRRQRLEREANEKVLRELEAGEQEEEGLVDVEQEGTDKVTYQVEVEPKSPLKLLIRRSSIPGASTEAAVAEKRPNKKAKIEDIPPGKVDDFKAMIIKRILKTVADTRAKRQSHPEPGQDVEETRRQPTAVIQPHPLDANQIYPNSSPNMSHQVRPVISGEQNRYTMTQPAPQVIYGSGTNFSCSAPSQAHLLWDFPVNSPLQQTLQTQVPIQPIIPVQSAVTRNDPASNSIDPCTTAKNGDTAMNK